MVPDQFQFNVLDLRQMVCKTEVKTFSTLSYNFFRHATENVLFKLIYMQEQNVK